MEQVVNEAYAPLFTQKPRYFILMGGRGAGRSTVASQFANAKLVAKEYFRCAIMRYVLGDIRNSIYREITDRAEENGILDKLDVNDSLMTISYGANSINAVGFRKSSGDQKAKLKSLANYNCVIIEEADEIPEADFMQLDDTLRTIKGDITVILLLNPPPKTHWIIRRWFAVLPSGVNDFYIPELKKDADDVIFIRTSYKDNITNLDATTVKRYENYKKSKPSHYYNMIEGLVPETVQGKIYNNWVEIDSIPFGARKERTGVDFGWFPDPATGVDIYYYNGGYIFDEVFYQTEMSNRDIGNFLLNQEQRKLVVADSAEPKSIDEIKGMGVTIVPCEKGADSVMYGIGLIQGEAISYTKRSTHLKAEYENYALKTDRDGEIIPGVPKEGDDHCLDAARYGMTSLVPMIQRRDFADNMPRIERKVKPNPAR
jgi:phage terminase large subunit